MIQIIYKSIFFLKIKYQWSFKDLWKLTRNVHKNPFLIVNHMTKVVHAQMKAS